MKLAISITVKNEENLLRKNILYHSYIGVDRFYVFLDHTTDNTRKTIEDLEHVEISESISPDAFRHRPELRYLLEGTERIFTARQGLNVIHAMERAMDEGIDWVISLDADELILVHPPTDQKGHLRDFFSGIDPDIEAVRFKNLEAVQTKPECVDPFTEERLFLIPGCRLPRKIFDPYRNSYFTIRGSLGHRAGKSAVRTNVKAFPQSSHKFVNYEGMDLKTFSAAYLLHYYCCGTHDFLQKYRNFEDHPDRFLMGGDVDYQKRLWRDMVNDPDFSEEYLRDYYRNYIMPRPRDIVKYRRHKVLGLISKKAEVIEVDSVFRIFQKLGKP